MANTPNRVIRVEDDLWEAYGVAVAAKGLKRSDDLRAHMQRTVRAFRRTTGDESRPSGGNQSGHKPQG